MGSCKRNCDRSRETAVSDRETGLMSVSAGSAACFGSAARRKQGIERGMTGALDTGQTVYKRCKKEDGKWEAGLCGLLFFDEKMKRSKAMMKGKKKRLLAGTLALLLSCSTLLNTGITALASGQSEEHVQIQEVKQEEAASEILPELEEVKEQLTEEELVYAEDLTIKAGEPFDLETDYRGFQKNDEKVKVTFLKAEGDSGNSFDFNTPDSYQAFYRVDPLSGNPSYQMMRRIVVEARENSTQESQGEVSQHTEDGSGEDGEADPDPEIPEVLTEEPEMPDAGAELIDLTPEEDKGMFLSVVPAAMEEQKGSNVHLVQGEKIPYPSNVGNYSTSYFTVNGHVAYCLESMKASPPTSDYVANEFESNPELQKVLYYGYGGPGDITGEYMPSFDWKTKYIFTHLAAAYSYCGMDGFYGCTFEDIKASGVWGYIQHIYSLEAPPTAAITLSPKETKAYESGKEQRTGEFTLKGDHRNYITLKMPENVTYHSGSTKKTGTVKISGNTTFYFTAPKTVTGTWNSGKLKGRWEPSGKPWYYLLALDLRILDMGHFLRKKALLWNLQ